MASQQNINLQDPAAALQAAIEELEVFTQPEASSLELGKDGRLVAAKENLLERVMGLARCYMGPLFSVQVRQEQEKKLSDLKKAILQARDIIQSHSALIEKFKQGDDSQRKLAAYALEAIQRYNAVVAHDDSSWMEKYNVHNYERRRLLLDQEIKGHRIELPPALSVKYDSHPDAHPAQKMLKELSETLLVGAAKKPCSALSPTHKKNVQFMMDTFRMKAIRMIQTHLAQQSSVAEVMQLVNQSSIEIDEESESNIIIMRQLLEVGPGSTILLTGMFNRHFSDSKFMTMPILDSFRLSSQLTHSGFPYPSQHTGWALADKWVEAYPLRIDQTPLFQQMEQRKKRLVHQLLFDQTFIQKARRNAKLKRDVFDQDRTLFLPLHRQLQQILIQGLSKEDVEAESVLKAFYQEAAQASSAFDLLVQTQQQLLDLFIRQPLKALEEEWLGDQATPLRLGTPLEKFQTACQRLEQQRLKAGERLDPANCRHAYILQQGALLGKAFQAVGLQYQSEKMGFAPPLLNDFERRLQTCAFDQILMFMDECDNRLDTGNVCQITNDLLAKWEKDLKLLQNLHAEEDHAASLSLVDELEFYFNSRFFTSRGQSRKYTPI